jgi:hypothetical protein
VQVPGYLAGAERVAGDLVPAAGKFALRLDGDTLVTTDVNLGALAARPFRAEGVGPDVSLALEQALRSGTSTVNGAPVSDPERLAELTLMTVRWDVARQSIVIASGRRGVVSTTDLLERQPSSVELVKPVTAVATGLGLEAEAAFLRRVASSGIRRPTPRAVAVDVRVDLTCGPVPALAWVLDAWTRTPPLAANFTFGLPSWPRTSRPQIRLFDSSRRRNPRHTRRSLF